MLRQIIVQILTLTSFFFSLGFAPSFAQSFEALKETGSARVIEVITPYTVQLDSGKIIHLTGLHYPDYNAQEAGEVSLLALDILKDMLARQEVRIYQTQDRELGRQNRMGHEFAHLVRKSDGLWVQGMMLSVGLAQVKTAARNPEMAMQMYDLEGEARKDKLGLWEDEGTILSPETAAEHLNSFQIVEGKIENVAMNNNRLYLNFGKNWRDDFTVSVAPSNLKAFNTAGYDFLQWGGRNIRVRGWIEDYNGPHIEIDHVEVLERMAPQEGIDLPP